jgi:hypothetical protein
MLLAQNFRVRKILTAKNQKIRRTEKVNFFGLFQKKRKILFLTNNFLILIS